jgi:hypothetical protein
VRTCDSHQTLVTTTRAGTKSRRGGGALFGDAVAVAECAAGARRPAAGIREMCRRIPATVRAAEAHLAIGAFRMGHRIIRGLNAMRGNGTALIIGVSSAQPVRCHVPAEIGECIVVVQLRYDVLNRI